MASPKISIIVPVYNVEKYIRRCLDSIAAQTFSDWECICVDDGTPDYSGKICDEYAQKDSRFVVIHKENGGVSSARNVGLDVAKGEWICFCDSDDWVEKDYLETWYSAVEKSNYDVAIANIIDEFKSYSNSVIEKIDEIPHKNIPLFLLQEYRGGLWVTFIKKQLLLQNEIFFDEKIFFGEDVLFKIHVLSVAKKALYVNKCIYHYNRINSESACYRISKRKCESMMNATKKMQIILKEKELYETYREEMDYRIIWTKLFWIKSVPRKERDIESNFSDSERTILGGNKKRFSKSMNILIFFIVNRLNFLANLVIDTNNFFRRPYSL